MNNKIIALTDVDLIYYFTKRTVDDAYLLIYNGNLHLFVDLRYYEAVKSDKMLNVHLMNVSDDFFNFLKSLNVTEIGLVYKYSTAKFLSDLLSLGYKPFDASSLIFEKTAVKTESEISLIKKACQIAEKSFLEVLPMLKAGVTESEIQRELEYLLRKNGAEDKAFDSIVAFGKGSSIPHYKTGNVKLELNMPVLFDFGCKYKGYLSDMSRSFYFGTPPKKYVEAFNAVKTAQKLAINQIKSGITGKQADEIARNYLKTLNLDTYFTHSLGHGIGVKIHEEPMLSVRSEQILQDNNVFSVEPGVYFEGEFGIRIEDTVVIKNGKCRTLMKTKIECNILN
ncbi:MAG: aminopeptidase P family protein [Clostridia bacterium]|nr:aminopeptidase P family protein [Clostridia bacterium]